MSAIVVGIVVWFATYSIAALWAGFGVAVVLALLQGFVDVSRGVRPKITPLGLAGIVIWLGIVTAFVLFAFAWRDFGW